MRRRLLVLVACLTTLVACTHDTTPTITVVFNHAGEVVEPPLDGVNPRFTHKQALDAITKGQLQGHTRVWFGSYQGKPAWLAVTTGVPFAHGLAASKRGYTFGVFADGDGPSLAGAQVSGAGDPPAVNVAPPRRAYNGRLHVTFITPGVGATASAIPKWKMEPAPKGTVPRQSVVEAQRRSQSPAASVGTTNARVYFGWFTGLDSAGQLHANTPAWVVVATKTRRATAFADDLTQPWVSQSVVLRRDTVVY
jgi:hypothetical protein